MRHSSDRDLALMPRHVAGDQGTLLEMTIYFREAIEPHVRGTDSLKYWHVEIYDADSIPGAMMFPVGIAYVVEAVERCAQLQFVFVADQWRGKGFGKRLLIAIKQRWPAIVSTSPIDEAGERLLRSVGLDACDED